jgi:hypothetical protein
MPGPIPTIVQTYWGTLVLDMADACAYLRQRDEAGNQRETLMMLDPSLDGTFSAARVTQAFDYFSSTPGFYDGATISVHGFWTYRQIQTWPCCTSPFPA